MLITKKKIPKKKGEYSELLPFCLCMKWTGDNIEWHWVWRGRAKEQHLSSDPPPTAYSTPIHSSDYPASSTTHPPCCLSTTYPSPIHHRFTASCVPMQPPLCYKTWENGNPKSGLRQILNCLSVTWPLWEGTGEGFLYKTRPRQTSKRDIQMERRVTTRSEKITDHIWRKNLER